MPIQESMQKFREQSPIHGVGFISVSKTTGGSFFWTVVVIIASCFAIVDFKNLIDFYQTEPTVVRVEVLKTSDIDLPVPTLCIETAGINPVINEWGDRYTWPYDRAVDVNGTIQKALQFVNLIKEITDVGNDIQTTKALEFLGDESNTDLVSYSYMVVSFVSSFEALISQLTFTPPQVYATKNLFGHFFFWQQKMNRYVETDRPVIEQLFQTYKSNAVSFQLIAQLVGSHICLHVYLNSSVPILYSSPKSQLLGETENDVYVTDVPDSLSICSPKLITYVSFPMICSYVADINKTTKTPIDFELFNINPISTRYLDLQGRLMFPGNDDPNLHKLIPHWSNDFADGHWRSAPLQTFVSAHVTGYQKFFNKLKKPCLPATNKFDGMLEQRRKHIHDICGCWPLMGFANASLTICSNQMTSVSPEPHGSASGLYTPLNAVGLADKSAYKFFNDSCASKTTTNLNIPQWLESCDAIQFQMSETIEVADKTDNSDLCIYNHYCHTNTTSSYRVKIYSGSFIALSESSEKNWSTFVSEFGGSIGVWLGASLIAFLHIPVYIFNVLYDYYKSKKASRLSIDPTELYSDDNISQSANELWQSTISGESFALSLQRPGIHM